MTDEKRVFCKNCHWLATELDVEAKRALGFAVECACFDPSTATRDWYGNHIGVDPRKKNAENNCPGFISEKRPRSSIVYYDPEHSPWWHFWR